MSGDSACAYTDGTAPAFVCLTSAHSRSFLARKESLKHLTGQFRTHHRAVLTQLLSLRPLVKRISLREGVCFFPEMRWESESAKALVVGLPATQPPMTATFSNLSSTCLTTPLPRQSAMEGTSAAPEKSGQDCIHDTQREFFFFITSW